MSVTSPSGNYEALSYARPPTYETWPWAKACKKKNPRKLLHISRDPDYNKEFTIEWKAIY